MKALWKQLKNIFDEFTDIPPKFSQTVYNDISQDLKAQTSNNSFIIASEIKEKENINNLASSLSKTKKNKTIRNIISSAKNIFLPSDAKRKDKKKSQLLKKIKEKGNLSDSVKESSLSYGLERREKEIKKAQISETLMENQHKSDLDTTENSASLTKSNSPDSDSLTVSSENIWEKTLEVLKSIIPGHSYKMWIEPVELIKIEENRVILGCPNLFSKRRVHEQYKGLIESELNNLSKEKWEVILDISERKDDSKKKRAKKTETDPQLMIQDPHIPKLEIVNKNQVTEYNKSEIIKKGGMNGRLLRKEFTFDRFVVGANNDFAYSASLSLASKKDLAQNSLFLLSDTGNGKSHLSQAIGHYILAHSPSQNVCYITAEDFINEMVYSFRHNSTDTFKEKYRTQSDVLILEDIHFLAGKERTQTELALALDYLI